MKVNVFRWGIKTESVGIGRLERFILDYHREHGNLRIKKLKKW